MQANTVKIQEVFQSNIVLKIPYFQRSYVWDEGNWERFLSDMLDLPETNDNYFLGSVILKKAGTNDFGYEQFDVVDGQQRLTTLVIFSKILYLLAGKDDKFRNKFLQDDTNAPVLQPNRKDASVFNAIVLLDGIGNELAGKGRVKDAYDYFLNKLCDPKIKDKANELIRFMNNHVYLVRITVEEQENEQQIFDTINSLGQDLTTGELLKNYLFNDGNVELYDTKWAPTFEKGGNDYNYWTDQLTKGRLKANNIEMFFYYFMLIKMQSPEIRTSLSPTEKKHFRKQEGLFESYKCLIRNHNIETNSLIDEIVEYAKIYHSCFNQDILKEALVKYPSIQRISFIMFAQGTWTPVPYLLYILKNVSSETERVHIFGYIENYLVRRMVCKSKNNNYSDLFSENLVGQAISSFNSLKEYLNDSESRGTLLMPTDKEVMEAMQNKDLRKESTLLLYLLESKVNPNFTNSTFNNGYAEFGIEPLMPIKYDNENWPKTESYETETRDVLIRTLGNQMLVRGNKLSSSKSLLKWSKKREYLKNLVHDLSLSHVIQWQNWNEDVIIKRNDLLGKKINEIWKK
nr:DUF262 domain-containing protein [Prevotella sp.]